MTAPDPADAEWRDAEHCQLCVSIITYGPVGAAADEYLTDGKPTSDADLALPCMQAREGLLAVSAIDSLVAGLLRLKADALAAQAKGMGRV